ncbi:hypothetical protein BO82DRAFT_429168 [Aspergillus uvarum CBS 121591]|uniref:Major facilitator superfamily (MFS) profile domain-containing protein n=1 Tax=Aspergillus uvarum CBS 121591 TaxID=1448315 RepID=A0A319CMP6_9EURO|nr:hypothetical protein BO82DRAFT_429168 [Aspergillus uvarum CBS 121591]PYH85669.1 hypothetical protein BO82DRAFT_429168 [Aspergillus uvarum CBS 121591]
MGKWSNSTIPPVVTIFLAKTELVVAMAMILDPTRLASVPASPAPENDTPPSHAVTVAPAVERRLGRRGVAFIGPACHLLAFAVISTRPPFPVLVIMYIFVGLGSGKGS